MTEQVLIRLGNIYGHLFTSQHKTDEQFDMAVDEWCASIGKYPLSRLTEGINKCKERYKKTVTLPEFMDCLKVSQYQAMIDREDVPALSKLETPEAKARRRKKGSDAIKTMLAGLDKAATKQKPKAKAFDFNEEEILNELEKHQEINHG